MCLCASAIECRYSLLPSKYSHSSFHFIFPSKRVYLCRYYALFLYGSLLLFPVCCQLLLFLHSFMFPFTFLSLSFLIAFPLYFSPSHSLPQCLPFLVVFPCLPFTSLSCYLFSQVLPFILNPPSFNLISKILCRFPHQSQRPFHLSYLCCFPLSHSPLFHCSLWKSPYL